MKRGTRIVVMGGALLVLWAQTAWAAPAPEKKVCVEV